MEDLDLRPWIASPYSCWNQGEVEYFIASSFMNFDLYVNWQKISNCSHIEFHQSLPWAIQLSCFILNRTLVTLHSLHWHDIPLRECQVQLQVQQNWLKIVYWQISTTSCHWNYAPTINIKSIKVWGLILTSSPKNEHSVAWPPEYKSHPSTVYTCW